MSGNGLPPLYGVHPAVFAHGQIVVYVLSENGTTQVNDFLEEDLSEGEKASIFAVFRILGDNPNYTHQQKFKRLEKMDGKTVWEVKKFQIRITCIWEPDRKLVLLLGLRKKQDEWKKGELQQVENKVKYFNQNWGKKQGGQP